MNCHLKPPSTMLNRCEHESLLTGNEDGTRKSRRRVRDFSQEINGLSGAWDNRLVALVYLVEPARRALFCGRTLDGITPRSGQWVIASSLWLTSEKHSLSFLPSRAAQS